MATILQIFIFTVALMVFFYPLAAMFSFYGEDGYYRFQKDRFILISSALGAVALVMAVIFTIAIPEVSTQDVADDTVGQPVAVLADATPVAALPAALVAPVTAQAQ